MDEQNILIVAQLNKCADLEKKFSNQTSKIKRLKNAMAQEWDMVCTFKTLQNHTRIIAVLLLIALIPSIIFAVLANSAKNAWQNAIDIASYPGEVYEEWLDSWANYNKFEELEPGWQAVQDDWKEKGLNVSWEYICDVWANSNSRKDQFKVRLKDAITSDLATENFTKYFVFVIISAIFIIAAAALLYLLRKKYKELKKIQIELPQAKKDSSLDEKQKLEKHEKELKKLEKELSEAIKYAHDEFGVSGAFYPREIADFMTKYNCSYNDAYERQKNFLREQEEQRMQLENANNLKRLADAQEKLLKQAEEQKRAAKQRCDSCAYYNQCSSAQKQSLSCSKYTRYSCR